MRRNTKILVTALVVMLFMFTACARYQVVDEEEGQSQNPASDTGSEVSGETQGTEETSTGEGTTETESSEETEVGNQTEAAEETTEEESEEVTEETETTEEETTEETESAEDETVDEGTETTEETESAEDETVDEETETTEETESAGNETVTEETETTEEETTEEETTEETEMTDSEELNETETGAPVLEYTETDVIDLSSRIEASDADDDDLIVNYSEPLNSDGIWETEQGDAGLYPVNIVVSDGQTEVTKKVVIRVKALNNPPVITGVPEELAVEEGETVTLEPEVTDPDGDEVEVTYTGWMSSPVKETDFEDAGDYAVTITASDGQAQTTHRVEITVVNVNRPPKLVIN